MAIEHLKCRADLSFEVDFGSNCAIGTDATWWDNNNFYPYYNFFQNPNNMPEIKNLVLIKVYNYLLLNLRNIFNK